MMAKVMIGEQQRQGGRGKTSIKGEDDNNRGGQQQQCLSFSNQTAIRKHLKVQQSATKMEVAGTIGCWKWHGSFVADRRGIGTG